MESLSSGMECEHAKEVVAMFPSDKILKRRPIVREALVGVVFPFALRGRM